MEIEPRRRIHLDHQSPSSRGNHVNATDVQSQRRRSRESDLFALVVQLTSAGVSVDRVIRAHLIHCAFYVPVSVAHFVPLDPPLRAIDRLPTHDQHPIVPVRPRIAHERLHQNRHIARPGQKLQIRPQRRVIHPPRIDAVPAGRLQATLHHVALPSGEALLHRFYEAVRIMNARIEAKRWHRRHAALFQPQMRPHFVGGRLGRRAGIDHADARGFQLPHHRQILPAGNCAEPVQEKVRPRAGFAPDTPGVLATVTTGLNHDGVRIDRDREYPAAAAGGEKFAVFVLPVAHRVIPVENGEDWVRLKVSYAHQADDDGTSREAVAAFVSRLHDELEADFRKRFHRDLEIFFDREDIRDFDDWKVRCHRALRSSRFLIVCLTRSYLRSQACRWEWEEWCKHELDRGLSGQGAACLWFVTLEKLDMPEDRELLRRLKGELLQRFHIKCHDWEQGGAAGFQTEGARAELQNLTEHVAQRLRLLAQNRERSGNLGWANPHFVGREPEMNRLRSALIEASSEQSTKPVGLIGVGGIGKTALALAFAEREADAFPGGAWILRCESQTNLVFVIRNSVHDLGIELTVEEKLDPALAVRRVFANLSQRGPALFLLDNVDQPALLAPNQMATVKDQPWLRLLFTTRLAPSEFADADAAIQPIDLDKLPEPEAIDLIRGYQPDRTFASADREAAAGEIVELLDGLTLAVETAAVYLGQNDARVAEPQFAVEPRAYLELLRADLAGGGIEDGMSQLREVAATIRPTLQRLDAPARTVLQVAALLAPDAVALPWLRVIAGEIHPELQGEAEAGQGDTWSDLVRAIVGMRLFQPSSEPRVVAVHRLLSRVLEHELREDRGVLVENLEAHVKATDTGLQNATGWQEDRWELEPFDALAAWWDEKKHPDAAWLLNQAGQYWRNLAEWTRAEPLMHRALAIDETSFGPEHPNVARNLNNLAQLLKATNRLVEAEPLMRRALEINLQCFGRNHPRVAECLNNLAQLLQTTNRLEEAEPLMRRALEIDEQYYGSDHPEVARDLNNLALLFYATNRLSEVGSLFQRALTIDEKSYGPEHPKVALRLNNLAGFLNATNRMVEA